MERSGVRSMIEALGAGSAGPVGARMRALLEANRPDVRYLVARVSGGGSQRIAPVCAAILGSAGAPTGILGGGPRLPGGPLDDVLYDRAATLVLSAAHQLGLQRPELGQVSRREAEIALALTAFAEASLRVVLLLEEEPAGDGALDAVDADITILGRLDAAGAEAALARLPDGRPVVAAPQEPAIGERIGSAAVDRALPLLLGGRDFSFEEGAGGTDVLVAGERYADLPRGSGTAAWELATGIVAALGVGVLGVRMRSEWVIAGAREAARGE